MLLFVGTTYGLHKPLMKDTVDLQHHITFTRSPGVPTWRRHLWAPAFTNFFYCFMAGILILGIVLKIAKILSNADLPFITLDNNKMLR